MKISCEFPKRSLGRVISFFCVASGKKLLRDPFDSRRPVPNDSLGQGSVSSLKRRMSVSLLRID